MKLFHVSCFVSDTALHDVMLFLEKHNARDLEVKTVRLPEPKAKPNGSGRAPRGHYDKPGCDVMAEIVAKSPLTWAELRDAFVAAGRPAGSMASALYQATQKKLIKRNSSGQYVPGSKA